MFIFKTASSSILFLLLCVQSNVLHVQTEKWLHLFSGRLVDKKWMNRQARGHGIWTIVDLSYIANRRRVVQEKCPLWNLCLSVVLKYLVYYLLFTNIAVTVQTNSRHGLMQKNVWQSCKRSRMSLIWLMSSQHLTCCTVNWLQGKHK